MRMEGPALELVIVGWNYDFKFAYEVFYKE